MAKLLEAGCSKPGSFPKNMSITKADLENLFLESPYFPTFNHKKISFFDYSFIIRSGYGQSVPTASITVFIKCDTTIFTLAHLKCYKVNGTWKLVKPEEEMKWSFRPVPALADSILRAWNRSISKSKSDVLPIAKAIEVWNLLNNYDTSAFKKFLLSQKEFEHYIKLNWGKLAISSDDSYKNYLLSALINYKSLCDSTKAHKNLKAQLGENSLSWMVVNQPYDSHNGKNYLTWMHFLIPTMDSNEKFFVSRFMFRKIDKKWKISNNENSFGKASYLRVATPVCELRCTGEYNY